MPHKLPEDISQHVKATIPPAYKMWWIRGLVLTARTIDQSIAGEQGWINTKVQVGDLDAPGEGYDVILEGKSFEFAEGDLVSLFGHEPVEAGAISSPRFLIHHNTGTYTRAYPETPNGGPRHWGKMTDYVNRLGCKTAATPKEKLKSLKKPLVACAVATVLSGGTLLVLFAIVAWFMVILSVASYFGHHFLGKMPLMNQPEFTKGTTKKSNPVREWLDSLKYQYIDVTTLYEETAIGVHRWVEQHPDTESGFVVVARGDGTQGQLVE